VTSVSLVPHFVFSPAGMSAHKPPKINATSAINVSNSGAGSEGNANAARAAPNAPIKNCPSPPMFQNFILKAIPVPSERTVSGIALLTVWQKRYPLPREPLSIFAYTTNGLNFMQSMIIIEAAIAATTAMMRTKISNFAGSAFLVTARIILYLPLHE